MIGLLNKAQDLLNVMRKVDFPGPLALRLLSCPHLLGGRHAQVRQLFRHSRMVQ